MPGLDAFVQGVLAEDGVRGKKKRPSMDEFMGQTLGGAGADAAPALSNIAPPSEMVYNPQTDIANRPLELPEGMPGAPTFRQPGILERAARGAAMLGTDIVGGLRQGAAGVVNWAKPSTMETEHLAWLRDLPEDVLQEALRSGQIPWQDTRYALLPPDMRREALNRAIQFRNAIAEGVGGIADAISPEPSPEKAARQYAPLAPRDPVRQAVQGIAGAVPGAAAMIGASAMGVPSPAIIAANVVAAQNAANEAVYNARMADGAEHPEAYRAATGASQVPQMATNLATTLAMLGAGRVLPMTVGGNVSPYVTQGLRTAAQMGAAATGDVANSAIQDVRSGQDVDLAAAGAAGLQGLLQAGLFGLYNTARDWKTLQGLQGTHRQVNETVRKINTAMEDLGLPKVNRQYGVNDASSMLSNSMRAGLLTPDQVFEALTKAGFDPAEVGALVRRGAPAQQGAPALHGAALPEQGGVPPVPAPTGQGGSGAAYAQQAMPAPAPAGQLEQVLSALQGVGGQDARIADLMRSGAAQPEALPMLPSSVVGGDVAPEVAEQLSGKNEQLGPTLDVIRGATRRAAADLGRLLPAPPVGAPVQGVGGATPSVSEPALHPEVAALTSTPQVNIDIPARSKTHHFVAEQSRNPYSHEINILRRDDYTDSKGRSRVKFVNVGSYSPLTGEFSGNVAKGSDKTVLGKLRAQVLEQMGGAQPAEAETQEPPAAVPEASPTPPEPETLALDMAATPVPDVVEPSRAEQILQSLEQLSGEEQGEPPAATQEVSQGIPADAKLRRGEMTVAYEGKDYEVTVSPWEKYGKRRLYLKEKATGKTIGHYDVARGEFGNDFKDSARSDAVKEQFLRQVGDWYEGGQKSAERQAQEDAAAVRRREASVLFPASAALKKGNITVEFTKGSPETLEVSPWERNGRKLYINEPWFHGRRGATIMYYDVDAGAFAGENTDYSVQYREAVKAAFLKDIKNFRQGTEDAPYAGKLRKEADARLASVAEIALDLDEGEGAGVVARIPETTRDTLYREILNSQGEGDFEKSKKIAGRVMTRIRELTGEKTPDLEMMRAPRSVRQSEEYDPGDPKTWPEGPARDEALALEAWQHLEDDDEVETWPESPEKAEALALQKEYREIEAWVEGHSVEEVLANDELNERGVHIEERLRDLRRDLRKKKPKGAAKRLLKLIETEEEAAAREAQEVENAEIDAELEMEDEEEYYQIIGKRGAKALDKAEEGTVRLDNLNIAREMEQSGKDARAIRLATGWERGADGKWRYEIPNGTFRREGFISNPDLLEFRELERKFIEGTITEGEQARLKELTPTVRWIRKPSRLADFYDSPELYAAYPELADISVKFQDRYDEGKGGYSPSEGLISLDVHLRGDAARSVLVHEIQHAIQNIEGFARGGNLDRGGARYHRLAGEVEARNAEKRTRLSDAERRERLLVETEDVARKDQIILENMMDSEMAYSQKQSEITGNIRRGRAAMEKVIAEHTDVMDAMYREDLGSISFLWGEPGRGPKFKGGAGVSHIIAHRNAQGYDGETVARKMVEVIAKGKVDRRYGAEVPGGERANIVYDGYTAALSLYKDGNRKTWLLTGWEDYKEKSPGAPSEGDGSTGATLSEPMRTRPEEGAGASDTSKPQPGGKSKTEGAEAKKEPVSVMDVTRKVRNLFPLRHGLGSVPPGKRRNILGVFGRKSEVLRTKYRNNLPIIMHELGHALDKELKLRTRIPEEALTELLRAGAPVSGEDYTPDKIANEGIAEFVREYAMNRKAGRDAFPKFTPIFERALHEKPDVLKNFEEVRKTLEAYYKQDAKARILDKGPNTRRLSPETLKERVAQIGHDLYSTWVDGNHELARVSERVRENLGLDVLPDELNLHAAAQTSAGYMAAADKSVAKLLDVVREHRMTPENRADLEAYMKAARALDYRRNGLNPGLGTTEAEERAIVESQTPQTVRDVARQLHDAYEEIVQETLVDTGLMAQKTFDMLKEKWPNYVPFIRTDSELHEDADVRDFLRGHARSLVNVQNPIKKARGVADEQEIMPVKEPLLHMLSNVVRYHHMAAKQGVAEVIREISRREGCGWIAERLKGTPTHSDDSTFYVWENGKQVYYATDPAIHKVLKGLNRGPKFQRGLVGRLLSLPSETLKMGATRYNPAFIITNALRDAAQVSVTSQSWAPPLAHTLRGVMMLYSGRHGGKWKELVDEATNEQVFYSGITDIVNSSPGELKRALRKAFNSGGSLNKAWDAFRDAAEKIGAVNEYIEIAPKLSEYYHLTRERGVPKREAARQAREANLDFQRAGTWGREANSVIAFFNAGVQGTDKILRAFRQRPGASLGKAFLYITLPSLLAWALNHKDEESSEEYRQIARWKKDLAWCVKMGGRWWTIPKPPLLGQVFGSLVERGLDSVFDKDPVAMKGFADTLVDQAVPNLMPTVFLPALEAYVNYNFFRDQPVIPRGKEKLPPELQYGPETSGVAKWAGEKTGTSPYKVDHLIRGYTGTVGGELAKIPDRLFDSGARPEEYWTEKPFVRSFFVDPGRTNEYIRRFYELANRTETAKNGYLARGETERTEKVDKDVVFAKMFQKVRRDLSEINGAIAAAQEDKSLPPSQKRKRIDDLRRKAIFAAKWALVQYDRRKD